MGILKFKRDTQSKEKKSHFVGGPFPPTLMNYMDLYSIANKVTTAEILRQGVTLFKKKQKTNKQQLIKTITAQIQELWDNASKRVVFEAFIVEIKLDLNKKHITPKQIEQIIKGIKK